MPPNNFDFRTVRSSCCEISQTSSSGYHYEICFLFDSVKLLLKIVMPYDYNVVSYIFMWTLYIVWRAEHNESSIKLLQLFRADKGMNPLP